MAAAAAGKRGRRGLAVARGHIGERLRGVGGVERVGEQHGVVDCAAQCDAERRQYMERQLPVVHVLGDGCVFEQRAQLGRERQAQRGAGSAQTPTLKLGLLLGGFGHVEQRHESAAVRLPASSAQWLGGIERKGKSMLARGRVERGDLFLASVLRSARRRPPARRAQVRAASK